MRREKAPECVTFTDLPQDVFLEIVQFLPTVSLLRIARTSRQYAQYFEFEPEDCPLPFELVDRDQGRSTATGENLDRFPLSIEDDVLAVSDEAVDSLRALRYEANCFPPLGGVDPLGTIIESNSRRDPTKMRWHWKQRLRHPVWDLVYRRLLLLPETVVVESDQSTGGIPSSSAARRFFYSCDESASTVSHPDCSAGICRKFDGSLDSTSTIVSPWCGSGRLQGGLEQLALGEGTSGSSADSLPLPEQLCRLCNLPLLVWRRLLLQALLLPDPHVTVQPWSTRSAVSSTSTTSMFSPVKTVWDAVAISPASSSVGGDIHLLPRELGSASRPHWLLRFARLGVEEWLQPFHLMLDPTFVLNLLPCCEGNSGLPHPQLPTRIAKVQTWLQTTVSDRVRLWLDTKVTPITDLDACQEQLEALPDATRENTSLLAGLGSGISSLPKPTKLKYLRFKKATAVQSSLLQNMPLVGHYSALTDRPGSQRTHAQLIESLNLGERMFTQARIARLMDLNAVTVYDWLQLCSSSPRVKDELFFLSNPGRRQQQHGGGDGPPGVGQHRRNQPHHRRPSRHAEDDWQEA